MTRVFISSARGHIDVYRATAIDVCHRLGLTPVAMEEMRPEAPPPLDVCHRLIAGVDVLVAIVGHAFGSMPGEGDGLCFTEHEIRHAADLGLPIHVFVVDPTHPWDPAEVGSDDRAAVEAMKQRLVDAHTTRPFTTVEAFREDLLLTLIDHVARPRDEPPEPTRVRPPAFSAHPPYVMRQTFTGRTGDLAVILDWADSDDPVLVVDGIGGLGKSALTWTWTEHDAGAAIPGLAGRFWWSFYEGSAQIERFVEEALAYIIGEDVDHVPTEERFVRLLDELRRKPYLLVLDGFERMLNAYHRVDPSKLRDDEVDGGARGLIDARAARLLPMLATCAPSKVLVGTRLMPSDLEGPAGPPLPGVRRHRLPDLGADDAALMVNRLGVRGDRRSVQGFFEPLGNHPLVIGVVCGMVRSYRRAPGDLDAWLADPDAGGAFRFADLPLTQKHAHVLQVALDNLPPDQELLLGWLSVLSMAATYETLDAINPFTPPRPQRPAPSGGTSPFLDEWLAKRRAEVTGQEYVEPVADKRTDAEREHEEALAAWESSDEARLAPARLDRALAGLEERGLLWWDRRANTYDLHPVVRAYAHDRLDDDQRVAANERVRDHFGALPAEPAEQATSVEDLQRSIIVFRATLGAEGARQARAVFTSRGLYRLISLAAYPTVIELLDPIVDASSEDTALLQTLAYAKADTGSNEEASALWSRRLEVHLASRRQAGFIVDSVADLADCYRMGNRLAMASRALELVEELVPVERGSEAHYWSGIAHLRRTLGDLDGEKHAIDKARATSVQDDDKALDLHLTVAELDLAFRQGADIGSALDDLEASPTWNPETRRNYLHLRAEHALVSDDHESALYWATEFLRNRRAAGMPTDNAVAHLALIRLRAGALDEARDLVDHVMDPSAAAARVAWELGFDDAPALALAAYEDAWADGPPFAWAAALEEATKLLGEMGVPLPSLPTTDPASITIPHEAELRQFIEHALRADEAEPGVD